MSVLEYETEYHFEPVQIDFSKLPKPITTNFVYGYFSPESRIRLRLIVSDDDFTKMNVWETLLETKVFISDNGVKRVKTIERIDTKIGLKLFEAAERTLAKTIRIYFPPTDEDPGVWLVSFELGTWNIISCEYEGTEPPTVMPDFAGAPIQLTDENRFLTYNAATPRSQKD